MTRYLVIVGLLIGALLRSLTTPESAATAPTPLPAAPVAVEQGVAIG
jgi:hypothetical protein